MGGTSSKYDDARYLDKVKGIFITFIGGIDGKEYPEDWKSSLTFKDRFIRCTSSSPSLKDLFHSGLTPSLKNPEGISETYKVMECNYETFRKNVIKSATCYTATVDVSTSTLNGEWCRWDNFLRRYPMVEYVLCDMTRSTSEPHHIDFRECIYSGEDDPETTMMFLLKQSSVEDYLQKKCDCHKHHTACGDRRFWMTGRCKVCFGVMDG